MDRHLGSDYFNHRNNVPTAAYPTTRTKGLSPCFLTASSPATTTAAAPSETPEAFPAFTVPSLTKTGFNLLSCSTEVSLGCSST